MSNHFSWWRQLLGHVPRRLAGEACEFVAICERCGSAHLYGWPPR